MRTLTMLFAAAVLAAPLQASEPTVAATLPYPYVEIVTSEGRMVFQLDRPRAPITVDNFIRYVLDGQYDGTVFHRVMEAFVIQGGGYLPDMSERPVRGQIVNESGNGLSNARGTLAMARQNEPHTATSQWYINVVDNTGLDPSARRWGYTVFGRIVEGEDVMDRIASVEVAAHEHFEHMPVNPIIIQYMRLLEEHKP